MFNVKISSIYLGAKKGPKLQIGETFTAASKKKWLLILGILEIKLNGLKETFDASLQFCRWTFEKS